MFRWRFTTDAHPRTKKGHPPQSTTGVASRNWDQVIAAGGTACCRGWPGRNSDTMKARIGSVRTSDHRKRRVMSSSSGFCSSSVTVRGSRAIPQIGHEPGSPRTISGCIGQVHSVLVTGAADTGSRAMPHLGQAPGPI